MISGLVAYLSADDRLAEAALHEMKQQPALELGAQAGLRQPLVLEVESSIESQTLTDWLIALPGVEHIDVAFVHLDESLPIEAAAVTESKSYQPESGN